jgi:hypothetical protein
MEDSRFGSREPSTERPEPLDEDEEGVVTDDEAQLVGRAADPGTGGLSAEEAAVHVTDER